MDLGKSRFPMFTFSTQTRLKSMDAGPLILRHSLKIASQNFNCLISSPGLSFILLASWYSSEIFSTYSGYDER